MKRLSPNFIYETENVFLLKKSYLLYLLGLIILVGNVSDLCSGILNREQSYLNLTNILLITIVLMLFTFKKIQSGVSIGILVYAVLLNLIVSQWLSSHLIPDYAAWFLRSTVLFGMIIPVVGFLIGKIHIIIVGTLYYIFYGFTINISHNHFLISDSIMIIMTTLSYTITIFYLVNHVKKIHKKQLLLNEQLQQTTNELQEQTANLLLTNELLQNQTQQIEKQAQNLQQLMTTRDKIYSIISHDLINPISAMANFSDLIRAEFQKSNNAHHIALSEAFSMTAKNTYELLLNLRGWTRIQNGNLGVYPEWFSLNDLVVEVIGLTGSSAKNKNIQVEYSCLDNIEIYADKNMIHTIMRNFLSNAIKFTPKNGKIAIFATKNDSNYQFSVKDTGIGMDTADIQKLFNSDVNFRKAGTNNENGTGLGLILCKEFVDLHHGTIQIESEPNNGSTFSFTAPTEYCDS